jgi:hypothetical protein
MQAMILPDARSGPFLPGDKLLFVIVCLQVHFPLVF